MRTETIIYEAQIETIWGERARKLTNDVAAGHRTVQCNQ